MIKKSSKISENWFFCILNDKNTVSIKLFKLVANFILIFVYFFFKEGVVSKITPKCVVNCKNPIRVPGTCCPQCQGIIFFNMVPKYVVLTLEFEHKMHILEIRASWSKYQE